MRSFDDEEEEEEEEDSRAASLRSHRRMQSATGMNPFLRTWFDTAIKELSLDVVLIGTEQAEKVRRTLITRFCEPNTATLNWNELRDYFALQHPESWQWLSEFMPTVPGFLLFNDRDELSVYRFSSGLVLRDLLGECPGFEFYVTDQEASFLLSHNDHDFLFAAGSAKEWLKTLEPRHEQWAAAVGAQRQVAPAEPDRR